MAKQPKSTNNQDSAALVIAADSAPSMLQVLKDELNKLKKTEETPYKTTGLTQTATGSIDIKTETKIPNLIKVMGTIIALEKVYNEGGDALPALEGNWAPFTHNGGTVDQWKHDINLRISVISYAERKKELEELVREGETFLTEKDKFKLYQQKLAKKLGSLGLQSIEEIQD